jgi:Spy/CpxP family protein refolding chaperone
MTTQGHTTFKIWLVLVVVFVLGSVTGAAITGFYHAMAHNTRPRESRVEKMRRDLSLTDEQMKSVSAILDETRNEYRQLKTELKPRFDEPRQKARTRIRALLSPEQQQKFDAMVAQQDAEREGEQRKQR